MFFAGLERLKETGLVAKVRGEGMVFGLECAAVGDTPATDVANEIVRVVFAEQSGCFAYQNSTLTERLEHETEFRKLVRARDKGGRIRRIEFDDGGDEQYLRRDAFLR